MKAHHLKQRVTSLVAAVAVTAGVTVAVQLTGMPAASAIAGLVKVNGPTSAIDSQPTKTDRADCPAGTRVIGGGGWVHALAAADSAKVALVALQPVHPASGPDHYVAVGQEITPNITTNWWVQAYAICASPVSGLQIISKTSSSRAQAADVFCPAGQQPLGGGGRVDNPTNRVALVGATPTETAGNRKYSAYARADRLDYTGLWTVTVYAVCAPTPPGYEVVYAHSTGGPSDTNKVAFVSCPSGKRVHGAAGTVNVSAPTGIALQVVYPFNALDQVEAAAVETVPTEVDWKPVAAVAICAT
jgi:hypothetical protein